MTWATQRTRIRRFLRDPNGNIWSDAFLLRLYNDEQYNIQNATGKLESVKVVRVPPKFQSGWMHEWEYPYTDYANGEIYNVGYYHDATEVVFVHKWEAQHQDDLTPTTSAAGSNYTQPWEALVSGVTAAEPPPIHLPSQFGKLIYLAWDKKPVDPILEKELKDRDWSWRTRSGTPLFYWRDQTESNLLYLYPRPSSITWQDGESGEADPDESSYGSTTLDVDSNLLAIFEIDPTELTTDEDEPDYKSYQQKYIEYGVIARAYGANTDGRIASLADYWTYRKKTGERVLNIFKSRRREDRDYRLTTKDAFSIRSRRHPRLPDAYPAVYP